MSGALDRIQLGRDVPDRAFAAVTGIRGRPDAHLVCFAGADARDERFRQFALDLNGGVIGNLQDCPARFDPLARDDETLHDDPVQFSRYLQRARGVPVDIHTGIQALYQRFPGFQVLLGGSDRGLSPDQLLLGHSGAHQGLRSRTLGQQVLQFNFELAGRVEVSRQLGAVHLDQQFAFLDRIAHLFLDGGDEPRDARCHRAAPIRAGLDDAAQFHNVFNFLELHFRRFQFHVLGGFRRNRAGGIEIVLADFGVVAFMRQDQAGDVRPAQRKQDDAERDRDRAPAEHSG